MESLEIASSEILPASLLQPEAKNRAMASRGQAVHDALSDASFNPGTEVLVLVGRVKPLLYGGCSLVHSDSIKKSSLQTETSSKPQVVQPILRETYTAHALNHKPVNSDPPKASTQSHTPSKSGCLERSVLSLFVAVQYSEYCYDRCGYI